MFFKKSRFFNFLWLVKFFLIFDFDFFFIELWYDFLIYILKNKNYIFFQRNQLFWRLWLFLKNIEISDFDLFWKIEWTVVKSLVAPTTYVLYLTYCIKHLKINYLSRIFLIWDLFFHIKNMKKIEKKIENIFWAFFTKWTVPCFTRYYTEA